jgi:hypothetical protein
MAAPVVLLMSNNPETLATLGSYLRATGLAVRTARKLATPLTAKRASAVVIFPDDYPMRRVQQTLASLRERSVLTVVVTRDAHLFARSDALVLAKPAWGWSIVEAIRERITATAAT